MKPLRRMGGNWLAKCKDLVNAQRKSRMGRCTFWRIKQRFAVIFFFCCPIRQNSMPKSSRRNRNKTHDFGDPVEFFLSAVSEPLAFPLLLHNISQTMLFSKIKNPRFFEHKKISGHCLPRFRNNIDVCAAAARRQKHEDHDGTKNECHWRHPGWG